MTSESQNQLKEPQNTKGYESLEHLSFQHATETELSISIVSMNNLKLLTRCLDSIPLAAEGLSYEVFVVAYHFHQKDLAELRLRYPWVIIIESDGIRGYSENNNLALVRARGKFCCILNDDVQFFNSALTTMVRYLDSHDTVGAVSPVLLNEDGTLQMVGRHSLTPWRYLAIIMRLDKVLSFTGLDYLMRPRELNLLDDTAIPIGTATGACVVVRTSALKEIGFLDERYFIGPDDIDLSLRLSKRGYQVLLLPHVRVRHYGLAIIGPNLGKLLVTAEVGKYQFLSKHHSKSIASLLRLLSALVSTFICFYWLIRLITSRNPGRARLMLRARWNVFRYVMFYNDSKSVFRALSRVRGGS